MRKYILDALSMAGLCTIVVGLWMWVPAIAVIVGGAFMVVLAELDLRNMRDDKP